MVLRNVSGPVTFPGQESVSTVVLDPVAGKGRWWGQYTDCVIIGGGLQALGRTQEALLWWWRLY